MSRCYEFYKDKWINTKPIRGRAVDTRPMDKYRRYRTWETIEKRFIDGQEVYAARLYETDVVMYYPDNSIVLRINSWATPTTADFMSCHSPFYICKKYNKIWVYPKGHGIDEAYPLPDDGELRFVMDADGRYAPSTPVIIEKQVVDRTKANAARVKIKPFIDWARSFNKLTDGWVMHDTREQFCDISFTNESWYAYKRNYRLPEGVVHYGWHGAVTSFDAKKTYEYLQTCDDTGWMQIYLALCDDAHKAQATSIAKVVNLEPLDKTHPSSSPRSVKLLNVQFKWETIQRAIHKMVHEATDTKKVIAVEAGKPMTGVV
jgi:hypothetical protein